MSKSSFSKCIIAGVGRDTIRATLVAVLSAAPAAGQMLAGSVATPDAADALRFRTVTAVRVGVRAPTIDGVLDEPLWDSAPVATDLIQGRPTPGAIATLRTEARIAYDDDALYVAVRMYDPYPSRIVAPIPRRDDETTSDWVFVEIDSRHDRRSAFSFGVNPRGVQVDGVWTDDVRWDQAWNGVWQSAARIDSLGWTAEYRIPFSQLALSRGSDAGELVFGFNVYRYAPRIGESSNWSPRLPTINGIVSRFNDVRGIELRHRPSRLEVTPYVGMQAAHVPSSANAATTAAVPRASTAIGGADVRMGLPGGFALTATVRPDFGQVEADPSQVNLTSFETYFTEQRPFFVERVDAFSFNSGAGIGIPLTAGANALSSESPFYSRRIGRPPHGATIPTGARELDAPGFTDILGAAKLVGRTANGWTAGVLAAQTATERATIELPGGTRRDAVVEPSTRYVVGRVTRHFEAGASAVGAMVTSVHRSLPSGDSSSLPANAVFAGVDARRRSSNGDYEASGFLAMSVVEGSAASLRAVERSAAHYLLRPDAEHLRDFVNDSLRTSLTGTSAQVRIAKLGGGHWRWSVIGHSISPAFEVNDVGFQRNSDWRIALGTLQFVQYNPGRHFRTWTLGIDQLGAGWSFGGERRAAVGTVGATWQLRNYWGGSASVGRELASLSTEALRGGPALLMPSRTTWSVTVNSDTRKRAQATLGANGFRDDGTGGKGTTVVGELDARLTDRLRVAVAPRVSRTNEALQYVRHVAGTAADTGYIVGRLTQTTASLTARADLAFSSHATLQLYTQPLIGAARYSELGEVVSPRAPRIEIACNR